MEAKSAKKFVLRSAIPGHQKDVRALSSLYYPGGAFISGSRDITAKVWTRNECDTSFTQGMVFGGHTNFIISICVTPPTEQYPHGLVYTGSNDHTINAYALDSAKPKYTLSGHEDTVCALAAGKFGTVLSGSWDMTARVWLGENCTFVLRGHTAAVWCVAIVQAGGYMLTGSADKSIRLWKAGKMEKVFNGHDDCVRGLAVLNPQEFLSCSNDASVRRWIMSGECVATYYGHTNYIYGIACLPNGHDFVTCGEDRTLRVWEDGKLVQTITHPAQSVWAVCVLDSGDVVTGSSDGVIRVFTRDPARFATDAELAAFEDSVASSSIPAQIGDIKTDDLPGPEALHSPGRRDGQHLMIRRGNNVEAYQWSDSESRWIKIGDVVGGSGGSQSSSGKVLYEGKEYDHVFDVDLGEGMPSLKLPYNLTQDPWMAAHEFLEKNELSQLFLDQVANFIQSQTAAVTLGTSHVAGPSDPFTGGGRYIPGTAGDSLTGSWGDPFTGGNRYIPSNQSQSQQSASGFADPFIGGSSYQPNNAAGTSQPAGRSYFPESTYIPYGTINVQGVMGKLAEFNSQAGETSRASDAELKEIEKLIADGEKSVTAQQLDVLWRLMQWPVGVLFPVLDILRHTIRYPQVNEHFCNSKDGLQFVSYCTALLHPDGQPKNHLLVLRTLCNAFQQPSGEDLVLQHSDKILNALENLRPSGDKNATVALASLVLNFIVGFRKAKNAEGTTHCLLIVHEIGRASVDAETLFRLLVAIGTAITDDKNSLEFVRSLNFVDLVNRGSASEAEKAKVTAEQLSRLIF